MKIIYYSPHPTHDIVSEVGYSTHQRETIDAMTSLGHEITLVIMGGTDKKEVDKFHHSLTKKEGLKHKIYKALPLILRNTLKDIRLAKHDKFAAAELQKAIIKHNPDLIYERNEYFQDKGVMVAKKMGIKHFLEVNSPCVSEMRTFEGPSLLHFIGLKKEKRKMQNTSHIFSVSTALKEHLIKLYHPTVSIDIIPNCINPDKELANISNKMDVRKQLSLEGKKIIGFVGSIFPYHGVDKLVKAFAEVVKTHTSSFLLIVGDGALRTEFENLAKELLPEKSFLFAGKIPHKDVIHYIEAFNIAVMPDSNWYGSPIKIFEYGMLKKPMIVPDKGPLHDVVLNDIDGLIVKSEVQELANAMVKILSNPDKYTAMGQHFYNKIMEEYTWQKQVSKTLSFV